MISDREDYFDPSEVPEELYTDLASRILKHILSQQASDNVSPKLHAMIRARTRLRSIDDYLKPDRLALQLSSDVEELGTRVRHYQYIDRYRYAFDGINKEMNLSFIRHSFNLRHSEIYLIRERAIKVLALAYEVALHFGFIVQPQMKKFTERFDKDLEYRLRERHRTTHSHEPPTLTGRTLETLAVIGVKDENKHYVEKLLEGLSPMLKLLSELAPERAGSSYAEFRKNYLLHVDNEAKLMWEAFRDYISAAVNL